MFKNYKSFWIYKKRSIKWWWSHLFWLKRVEMTNKRIEHVKSAKMTYLLFLFKIFKLNLYKNGSADYFPVFCIELLYSQGNYINDKSHSTLSLNYTAGSRNSARQMAASDAQGEIIPNINAFNIMIISVFSQWINFFSKLFQIFFLGIS